MAAAVRLPDPPFIDTIVDGLDRLPCLRWLEYYQGDRSELVAVPRQLWSLQQLTWLSLCGVRQDGQQLVQRGGGGRAHGVAGDRGKRRQAGALQPVVRYMRLRSASAWE